MAITANPITAANIDPTAAQVTLGELGNIVVMAFTQDDGTTGVRILTELPDGTAVEVEPA